MNKIHSYTGNRKYIHGHFKILRILTCCILALFISIFTLSDTVQAINSSGNASSAKDDTGHNTISVQKNDNQIIFNLPLDDNIDVSPDYTHPNFKLNFSPAVTRLQLPKSEKIDLVRKMNIEKSSIDHKISSLQIVLKQKVQFLLSRTNPENLQLKFVPGLTRKASTEESKQSPEEKPDKKPLNELRDVQFTQDDEGTLFIKLLTKHKTNYKPKPQQDEELVFLLSDLKIPSNYAKIYDLQKFQAPVEKAILQDTEKGGELELSFSKRSPISVTSKDNKLIVSIQSLSQKSTAQKEEQGNETVAKVSKNKTETADTQGQQEVKRLMFPEMRGDYTGKKISLDLQNADIEHVLRLIAKVAGYNLVIGDNVSGEISLKLENIPWDQALDLVLIQKDLGMVKKGNILRVVTINQLQKEQQRIKETQESAKERAPLHTAYIQINYTNAGQIQSNVKNFLSDRGEVSIDERTNQLIVEDIEENIQKVREVVRKLDRPERQVLIEARLVYATDSFQRSLGVQWGGGYEYQSTYNGEDYNQGVYGSSGAPISVGSSTENSGFAVNTPPPTDAPTTLGLGGFISKISGSNLFTLDAKLQIGESKNQAKTISAPRVVTLNNQEAEMVQGTMVATQSESESGGTTTEYTEATLNLNVTPKITPNDKVILNLEITDDSPAADSNNIETREASTKVIVDNNETIVLGGVREVDQSRTKTRVPYLADIPLLGWLFKSDSKKNESRELLIFIKPKLLEVS